MTELIGKAALVTGAGVRLGRAIAEALARHGCRMILHCNASRDGAEEVSAAIQAKGGEAVILSADLSKSSEASRLAREAEQVFGGVDLLVNNAAVFWPTPLEQLDEAELDAFIAINLKAPYILSSEIGRAMKRRGEQRGGDSAEKGRGGVILNIACLSGLMPWKTHLPYSISKAGVVALTQGLSKLLAPEVRVNAVAPGTVLPPEEASAESIEALRTKIPLRKIGSAEDIADAALYLLSAPFVTGQILCVDGGRSLH